MVFRQPGAPDPGRQLPAGLVRRVWVVDLPAHGRSFAARALRNALRVARGVPPLVDRFAGFGREIERALEGRRYDIGIVEHFWCAPYGEQVARVCGRTVLDLHNIESVLDQRCAEVESGARRVGPPRIQPSLPETGANLAAAFFRGAGGVGERRGTGARHCAGGARDGVPQRHSRRHPCPPEATRTPSSSRATWSTIPTFRRCGSFAGKSGRCCGNAGRGWYGG